jgi:hypothetical protein
MTNPNSGNIPINSNEQHWPTTVAALAVRTAFFSLWFWLLPQWLGFRVEMAGAAHWRWLVALPSVLGFAVALRCVLDFGWTGHGTPAPIAPPQRLVVVGWAGDTTGAEARTMADKRNHEEHLERIMNQLAILAEVSGAGGDPDHEAEQTRMVLRKASQAPSDICESAYSRIHGRLSLRLDWD